jgi:uncharacterized protein (TIGR02231 family)
MIRPLAATSMAALAYASVMLSAAEAADVTAPSRVDAVTVYPSGAEIARTLRVKIEPGEHAVVINDLPAGALPQSIRVEGKSTGGQLQIGSVDSRRLSVPRADSAALAGQRREMEDRIEKLRDQRLVHQADIQAAEAQKLLINGIAQLPGRPVTAGASVAEPDWMKLLALVGEKTAAVQRAILDTNVKLRDIDRQVDELVKKLATLAPAPDARTEVKVFVSAAATTDVDLVVRYQVASAGWTPFYDARLATGAKGQAAKMQLVRRASIQQQSGEAWDNVALTLSTTRPSATTAAPDLHKLSVDYMPERPVPVAGYGGGPAGLTAPPAPPAAAPAARARAMAEAVSDSDSEKAKLAEKQATEMAATADTQSFQVLYAIPGKVSVAPTGEQKRVQIGAEDLEPSLVVRTVPRLDPLAYLYAKLTMPKTSGPVLPGNVSLFRDGTFVGQGRVPQLAAGEDHELGFGTDDQVKVKRVVIEDKKGESGVFTTTRGEERNFTISVKNLRANPVLVQVLDRIPVSMQQDIKVEPTFKPQPTTKDVKDRRGTVAWDLTVLPDQETQIAFGYKVSSPAGKPVLYRELSPQQIFQGNQVRF